MTKLLIYNLPTKPVKTNLLDETKVDFIYSLVFFDERIF